MLFLNKPFLILNWIFAGLDTFIFHGISLHLVLIPGQNPAVIAMPCSFLPPAGFQPSLGR
jgi:hypothetical protein